MLVASGRPLPPAKSVVVPYVPNARESKFCDQTTCAWLVTVKPLNAATTDIILIICFIFFVGFNLVSDTHCRLVLLG
jgi:hypothetical protein